LWHSCPHSDKCFFQLVLSREYPGCTFLTFEITFSLAISMQPTYKKKKKTDHVHICCLRSNVHGRTCPECQK
jgi:hypothetical protein